MPFSFPSSPTVGQQSTQNGRVYAWSGAAWELATQIATHTHALADLTQSGATTNQVVAWNGTAWAPATVSGGGSYTLPNATTSTLGGVIVGTGLSVSSGTISANVTSVAGRTGAVTIAAADVSGLATVATSGSAADLSGTLNAARLPASGVTAGTYTSVTVDTYGRVTAGSSPAVAYSSLSGIPATFAPSAHKASHATGGSDALAASDIGAVATSDARLTDSREWSADTVSQAEAEAGTATTRRAWTAQRVFQAVAAWWAASTAKTKLDGIATGATANATDAQLRDRSTHTGTQAASTISDFSTAATAAVTWTTLTGKPSTFSPAAHKSSHATGGSDALAAADIGAAASSHTHAWSDIAFGKPTTLSGYGITDAVGTSDSRLADSREWTASTITQAEAEAGTATTRRAFTAQRTWQAIAAYLAAGKTAVFGDESSDAAVVTLNTANSAPIYIGQNSANASIWSVTGATSRIVNMTTGTLTNFTLGNIASDGKLGTTANVPLITGTGGVISAGAFGSGANQFCQGNDPRLTDARTPTSHAHGNITNAGAIGSTSGQIVVTTTSGVLTTATIGSGLTLSGGTLTASGGGGSSVGSDLYLWATFR